MYKKYYLISEELIEELLEKNYQLEITNQSFKDCVHDFLDLIENTFTLQRIKYNLKERSDQFKIESKEELIANKVQEQLEKLIKEQKVKEI